MQPASFNLPIIASGDDIIHFTAHLIELRSIKIDLAVCVIHHHIANGLKFIFCLGNRVDAIFDNIIAQLAFHASLSAL